MKKKNKLVAIFGWKYEPEWMVDQLKENLKDWVDDFAILDCRDRKELWIHEGEYRKLLREKAFEMDADWVLVTSPDERWEKDAGKIIRPMIDDNTDKVIYEFDLREMYKPDTYRTDGVWGAKFRRRLYPLKRDQKMAYQKIQCPSCPQDEDYSIKHLDVNIYHLKMIERENRMWRTEVFKFLDPDNKYQGIGYDYLMEEYGAMMEKIPKGREYSPDYKKFTFTVPPKYLVNHGKCFVCGGDV